jgi:acetyl esterase
MSADDQALHAEDVTYLSHASGPLLARLYRPAAGTPRAALVSVHGGRWIRETRLTNAIIDSALAASGVLVMALDFRMPPVARYPEPVADIHYAIRWLKSHAAGLGIPAAKIGGMGTSSGGHQLMLNAMRPADPRYAALPLAGGFDAKLGFAILGWPVIDPLARYRYAQAGNKETYLEAHHAYWASEAEMAEGNPQLILERGETAELPPVLLLQGSADEALPSDMAARFAAAYEKAGGKLELVTFAGEPHTFVTKSPGSPASDEAIGRIVRFVAGFAS